jgi:hypothetical protein
MRLIDVQQVSPVFIENIQPWHLRQTLHHVLMGTPQARHLLVELVDLFFD